MDGSLLLNDFFLVPQTIPKVALITGATIRLGREIALTLARVGFDVAIHARCHTVQADQVLQEIQDLGRSAILLTAELSNPDEVGFLIEQATQKLGPIGVLVNNASVFDRDEWDTVTLETWQHHQNPNLWAPFQLIQDFAKALPTGAEGCVINMLDQRVWSLTPHFVSYTISKAALWTLTQTMALALASKSIRVNAIGPGPAMAHKRQSDEQFNRQCQSTPLGQGTSSQEVARAVLGLLCLPSVTGQMLALDGGQHLQWSPALGVYNDE
ncbi:MULTISPECIES: SDR family oxidoreductase [Commensalibacter]|uniref:Short chain dehydrogenase n=2 Tax=Commensalibacter TaxID=1079922 RepID=W7DVQ9_9PROT|nr:MULTISPECIES: SDR family oxidoreductase [Commensalibacter]EUK19110.1 short chain dehydrogenase [Commensalibacter papalotli (ex Servin-Garciduenas et al. 2014)]CAI3922605.1 NAD(P)-dependent dehydrogenase [Commensalibacter papalotli (ex Botero et al. 2024)]CAI3929525.1 NAD(P)-dependent dehydrogenase [Commensalibacter papalotli (ex Botero et al. 2024)]